MNQTVGRPTKQPGRKYRNRIQILCDLLRATGERHEGLTKTKMMYKALLSYNQVSDYVPTMLQDGLIEYHDDTRKFTTTQRGFQVLKNYEKIAEIIPDIDLCSK